MLKKKVILLIVSMFLISGCGDTKSITQSTEITGKVKKVEGIILKTIKDEKIEIEIIQDFLISEQLKDKIVLINFWAPWCAPCKKEIPALVNIMKKYKKDFIVVGVLFDEKTNNDKIKDFVKRNNINFPITISRKENMKLAKKINNIQMIPESFLYSKEGFLIKKYIGEIEGKILERDIKKLKGI